MYPLSNQRHPLNPDQVFLAQTLTLAKLLGQGGVGLIVPPARRPFTWASDQVGHFVRTVVDAAQASMHERSHAEFLGSILLVPAITPDLVIGNLDPYAGPKQIYAIIDGKQRLATLALLASRLYWRLHKLYPLTFHDELTSLRSVFHQVMHPLLHFCAFENLNYRPHLKPMIIHGRVDAWNKHDDEGTGRYKSLISRYLNDFLLAYINDQPDLPVNHTYAIANHLVVIDDWLDEISHAHHIDKPRAPTAWRIRAGMHPVDWIPFNSSIVAAAIAAKHADETTLEWKICASLQLWAFAQALLNHCCVTLITPTTKQAIHQVLQREIQATYE